MTEKIISVKEGKVVEKDGKDWIELTDQEDKTHRIFRSIQNNEGAWVHLDKEVDMLKYRIEDVADIVGLALKLTKEKKGLFWNVTGVEEIKGIFEKEALKGVRDARGEDIDRAVAIKEIGECWRADKMKDNEPEVEAYRAWILDKLNGYMKGAKDVKKTEELPKEEAVPRTRGVDDTGGGTQVTNTQTLMKWAKEKGYYPSWVRKEALLGDGLITDEEAVEACKLLKKNMKWED